VGFAGQYLARDLPHARYFFIEPLASLEGLLEAQFGAARNLRAASSFDSIRYVLLLDVLEHQDDDRAFLADLIARMAPGSEMLLTVPALRMLWSDWDVVLGHRRRYDKKSLRAAIPAGAVVEELSYVFPEMLPLGIARRFQARSGGTSGEFPDLPSWINEPLYWLGRGTIPLRRLAPFGTSLYARLRK
jgi:hypothetical protein